MDIKKLEERMHPGKHSEGGFLGPKESLEEILKEDDETVARLGFEHRQIAAALDHFLTFGFQGSRKLNKHLDSRMDLNRPIVLFGGTYAIEINMYDGHQDCPWGCTKDQDGRHGLSMYGGLDATVTNQKTGEKLKFPGLIIHLISDHHFYEGKESPYRVDPRKVVTFFELVPLVNPTSMKAIAEAILSSDVSGESVKRDPFEMDINLLTGEVISRLDRVEGDLRQRYTPLVELFHSARKNAEIPLQLFAKARMILSATGKRNCFFTTYDGRDYSSDEEYFRMKKIGEKLFTEGEHLFNIFKLDKSLKKFELAIATCPDLLYTLNYHGLLLDQLYSRHTEAEKWHQRALIHSEKAIRELGNVVQGHYYKALALFCLGRFQEALGEYETVAGEYPKMGIVMVGKAATLDRLGRYEEAIDAFRKASEIIYEKIEESYIPALRREFSRELAGYLAKSVCMDKLAKTEKVSPEEVQYLEGVFAAALGNDLISVECLERATKLDHSNSKASEILAIVYLRLAESYDLDYNYSEAERIYKKVADINEKHLNVPRIWFELGTTMMHVHENTGQKYANFDERRRRAEAHKSKASVMGYRPQ